MMHRRMSGAKVRALRLIQLDDLYEQSCTKIWTDASHNLQYWYLSDKGYWYAGLSHWGLELAGRPPQARRIRKACATRFAQTCKSKRVPSQK